MPVVTVGVRVKIGLVPGQPVLRVVTWITPALGVPMVIDVT